MKKNYLEILDTFDKAATDLKNTPTTTKYWEEVDNIARKRAKKNRQIDEAIKMTSSKYRECFSI